MEWESIERRAREEQGKADGIEEAVYDLKAVNPNRVSNEDKRTAAELLDYIEAKGREADAALQRLRLLMSKEAQKTAEAASDNGSHLDLA